MPHARLRLPGRDPRLREDRHRRALRPDAERRPPASAPRFRPASAHGPLMDPEAVPEAGWVAPLLGEEFPGLALRYLLVEGGSGRTPRHVKGRLAGLSNTFSGPQA